MSVALLDWTLLKHWLNGKEFIITMNSNKFSAARIKWFIDSLIICRSIKLPINYFGNQLLSFCTFLT